MNTFLAIQAVCLLVYTTSSAALTASLNASLSFGTIFKGLDVSSSVDGKISKLATGSVQNKNLIDCSMPATLSNVVSIWDSNATKIFSSFSTSARINYLVFLKDVNRRIAVTFCGKPHSISIYEQNGTLVKNITQTSPSAELIPNNFGDVLSGNADGGIRVYEFSNKNPYDLKYGRALYPNPTRKGVRSLCNIGQTLPVYAVSYDDNSILIWNLNQTNPAIIQTLETKHTDIVWKLVYFKGDLQVASLYSGSLDKQIVKWSIRQISGYINVSFSSYFATADDSVTSLSIFSYGPKIRNSYSYALASGDLSGNVVIWDNIGLSSGNKSLTLIPDTVNTKRSQVNVLRSSFGYLVAATNTGNVVAWNIS